MEPQIELALKNGMMLPLMEAFYTIQGEGYFAGQAAYFLRIGGCDVGCHWCDVKESWDALKHPPTSVEDIILNIKEYSVDTVVITGGEPLMWDLNYLTNKLKENNYKVHLETSGSHKLTGSFDWICLSPKKMQFPLQTIKPFVNELKIIINNKRDLIWAEEQRKGLNDSCCLYLQPEWSRKEKVMPFIIDFVKSNKCWTISLQTQKYMNIP
tara:strand:+ start:341 stop:973 length:633 start_codon:yes stop_codon:yes gene_type:complete